MRRDAQRIEVALSWKPETVPDDDGSRISILEEELSQLRRIAATFSKDRRGATVRQAGGRLRERGRRTDRPAGLDQGVTKNSDSGEWQWPFSERTWRWNRVR